MGYLQLQREIKTKHVSTDTKMEIKYEITADEYPLPKAGRLRSAEKLPFPYLKGTTRGSHSCPGHNFMQ